METPLGNASTSWPEKHLSLHLGSFDALVSFLLKHDAKEVCLKSLLSPLHALHGESVRHSGVCVSACLYKQPAAPIAYATFLAGSGAWIGKHSRLLYPTLTMSDPLRLLPAHEVIARLQHALFFTLAESLQGIPELSVVTDAQWDVSNAWAGIAKGFVWQNGSWQTSLSSPASLFSLS